MYTNATEQRFSSEVLSAAHRAGTHSRLQFHFFWAMGHECTCTTTQQKQKLGAGQHARYKSDETQPNSPPLQRETWESEEQAGSLEQPQQAAKNQQPKQIVYDLLPSSGPNPASLKSWSSSDLNAGMVEEAYPVGMMPEDRQSMPAQTNSPQLKQSCWLGPFPFSLSHLQLSSG